MQLCNYGCGQEATYQFKNGKWCCSKSWNSCVEKKRKSPPWNKDKTGLQIPWNKGKTGIYSKKVLEKMSQSSKGKIGYWTGKKRYKDTIEKIKRNHANVSGENNPNWKGGYSGQNIPLYDNFFNRLTIEESPKKDLINNKILTILCAKCKKRFIPKLSAVEERVRALNGGVHGEARLYCSEECKHSCSIFGKHSIPNGLIKEPLYTSQEYQTWRLNVLKRENYLCEYCDEKATDVHHSRPQKLEPGFVLDPDFGVACCEKCHYKYGHKNECSTGQLANKICK